MVGSARAHPSGREPRQQHAVEAAHSRWDPPPPPPSPLKKEFDEGKIRQLPGAGPTSVTNCYDYATVPGVPPVEVSDPETLFTTDYEIQTGNPQWCNVIVYFKHVTPNPNSINWADASHAAHVTEVDGATIKKVASKWGDGARYEHNPEVVPSNYLDGNQSVPPYLVFKRKP